MQTYDMIVIGGGPSGYTAALYGARAGLRVVVMEKLSAGGQMALTHMIDNYPGYDAGIDGFELGQRMQQGALRFGAETKMTQVLDVDLKAQPKVIKTDSGVYFAQTVVVATGAEPRMLGLANEAELTGRGIHYCAACDGMFYRGKTVVIVGGGNSAAADALTLSRLAKKVVLVHRRDNLRAEKVIAEGLERAENVQIIWNTTVDQILSDGRVRGVRLRNVHSGEESEIPCDGLFISIGRKPASSLVQGQLELDSDGYIVAGEDTRTNIPGVFVVGDVRAKAVRQIVTATADGAAAAYAAEGYLAGD